VGALPSLAPLVKQLRPAVLNVYTTARPKRSRGMRRGGPPGGPNGQEDFQEFFERFFGGPQGEMPEMDQKRQALGSGFLIGDGFALTNNHVIEGADEIRVKLSDGREFDAKVTGRDPSTDVALLKLQGDEAKKLTGVKLGNSDGLEVGDYVVAIGNPFGLSHTVTSGIVSAQGRIIGAGPYDDFIQTDASINPGNSGGPLFNLAGEVVGINTAIIARGQGIGFAVPVNMVKDLLPQLRDAGKVARGWLGIGLQEVSPELAKSFGLEKPRGALVAEVFPNSPAAKAGLVSGDVLVEVNGKAMENAGAITRSIALVKPNDTAKLKVLREGKERVVEVKVGERDEEALAGGRMPGGSEEEGPASGAAVGLSVSPITPEISRRTGLKQGEGLAVTEVQDGGAAEAAGVQPGDALLELQRRPVASVDAFRKIAREIKPGDTVLFRVRRGGSALYLAARAPAKQG